MRAHVTLLALSSMGYALAQTSPTSADVAAKLRDARAQWQEAAVSDYLYGFNKFCECHRETPPETLVEVREDVVTDVRHVMVRTGDTVAAASDNFELYWTVDDLFGLLERALQREAVVRADFDPQFGVPRSIYVDYLPDMIGDELDVRITRFETR